MKLRNVALIITFSATSAAIAFADGITLNTNASQLAAAITAGNVGVTVTSATLQGQSGSSGIASTGTFSNIYGLSQGAVMSTGNAADYGSGPNNYPYNSFDYGTTGTASENALLNPLTNGYTDHHDVTELDVDFTVASNVSKIYFNTAFGSEEYPDYVGSQFVDAFGLYLNGTNIAFVGGQPVNIDNSCFEAFAGTELNGVLACNNNPINTFSGTVHSGINTLTFIISDTSDGILDTTAYLGALGTNNVSVTPEPSSWMLLGTGMIGAAGAIRRRLQG